MKYELLGFNDTNNPIPTVLSNRGIDDYNGYVNIDETVKEDWELIHNMRKGVELLGHHIVQGNKIAVDIDPDADGLTSAAQLCLVIKRHWDRADLEWILPEGKKHELDYNSIPKGTKLVITPDSGSNEFAFHKKCKENGIDVLVIDHHLTPQESEDAVVINNQLSPDYSNKTMTGAGMVNKFIEALDSYMNTNYAPDYYDLVSIGLVADAAPMVNDETRWYVWEGLKTKQNKLLEEMYTSSDYNDGHNRDMTRISFTIAPKFNAAFRMADKEVLSQVFESMLGKEGLIEYKYRKEIKQRSYAKDTLAKLASLHNKSKKIKKEGLEGAKLSISKSDVDKRPILLVENMLDVPSEMNGLIAMELSKEYRRPILFMKKGIDGILRGSGRGFERTLPDFRGFLESTGLFEYAQGHANAFGAAIKKSNIQKFYEVVDQHFETLVEEPVLVDFVFDGTTPNQFFMNEIDNNSHYFGRGVEAPSVILDNLVINTEDLKLSTSGAKLDIQMGDIDLVFFQSCGDLQEIYDDLRETGYKVKIRVLGEPKISHFARKHRSNIVVQEFEILEVVNKEKPKFGTSGANPFAKSTTGENPFATTVKNKSSNMLF
ncbi:DHH family phosphoesterase [Brochothrix thermosphacta]|uniref:DHH family phosphoesterase n=1 Tax=Brochothrix thermosphacta TaxID=2756 RepID=UPI002712A2F9|nr:DHH family phosphoesterase [Brochothrix thermosphacta]MDO7864796.1 DHH family phosphoesterase [Brochothrix thermosphacta]